MRDFRQARRGKVKSVSLKPLPICPRLKKLADEEDGMLQKPRLNRWVDLWDTG